MARKSILVVDDEPVILQTMRAILETRGWQVRTAEDGFEGLRLLRETPPDLIISGIANRLHRKQPKRSTFIFCQNSTREAVVTGPSPVSSSSAEICAGVSRVAS